MQDLKDKIEVYNEVFRSKVPRFMQYQALRVRKEISDPVVEVEDEGFSGSRGGREQIGKSGFKSYNSQEFLKLCKPNEVI